MTELSSARCPAGARLCAGNQFWSRSRAIGNLVFRWLVTGHTVLDLGAVLLLRSPNTGPAQPPRSRTSVTTPATPPAGVVRCPVTARLPMAKASMLPDPAPARGPRVRLSPGADFVHRHSVPLATGALSR
ncbi:MAG: hypothetical protein QOF39_2509 [Frankiales bacterium]|nr:hypothetical protein [Frankiales bacterium]